MWYRCSGVIAAIWLLSACTVAPAVTQKVVPGMPGRLAVETNRQFCLADLAEPTQTDSVSPDGAWKVRAVTAEDMARYQSGGLVLTETASGREVLVAQRERVMPIAALRWSPDSRRVAVLEWSMAPVAFGTVFVVTLDDLTLKAIADYGGPIRSLAWSPDSSMVAYSSARIIDNRGLGPVQVWVARADGSQPPAAVIAGCAPQWTGPTLSAER